MIYCDTSLLVTFLTDEPDSQLAAAWIERHAAQGLMISDWTNVEVASALAMKQRRGALDGSTRQKVWRAWVDLATNSFEQVRVDRAEYVRAAGLVDNGAGLRAGDALHLAVAIGRAEAIATRDRDMSTAAAIAGIECFFIEPGAD